MAKLVLGLGTSHGPQLFLQPEQWELRATADRQNPQHWYRGKPYNYETLLAEYTSRLFRWQQPGLYRKDGEIFEGVIRDVLPDGHLCLEKNGEILQLGFGEVEFIITR